MNTTTVDPIADQSAAAIAAAKAELEAAKRIRRAAEKYAEATREAEATAAGYVAVAIAKAIQRGADPVLVLPSDMLTAHRDNPRIIASPAELTMKRIGNSLSMTGSRFPGWMEITVGEIHVHYMPTPLWMEWSEADSARRTALRAQSAA